jgi:hypothetical protein
MQTVIQVNGETGITTHPLTCTDAQHAACDFVCLRSSRLVSSRLVSVFCSSRSSSIFYLSIFLSCLRGHRIASCRSSGLVFVLFVFVFVVFVLFVFVLFVRLFSLLLSSSRRWLLLLSSSRRWLTIRIRIHPLHRHSRQTMRSLRVLVLLRHCASPDSHASDDFRVRT